MLCLASGGPGELTSDLTGAAVSGSVPEIGRMLIACHTLMESRRSRGCAEPLITCRRSDTLGGLWDSIRQMPERRKWHSSKRTIHLSRSRLSWCCKLTDEIVALGRQN